MARSSTIEQLPPKHQVFINFRGVELRKGFVSHLVAALRSNNINVFIDSDQDKGKGLEILLKRIEESRIALVIFSQRYTESAWCLRELARINACMYESKLVAIPIFYKVEPSAVKGLKGQFGDAFRHLKESDAMKKKEWKKALKWISCLMGFAVDDRSNEGAAIQDIVMAVIILLAKIPSEGSLEASVDSSENIETAISSGGEKDKTIGISSGEDAKTNADFLERTFTNSPRDGKVKPINKSHGYYWLSDLQEDASTESSKSEDLKGVARERDGILLYTKTDRDPMEAEIVQPEAKSRIDDGLNLTKDEDKTFGIKQRMKELGDKLDLNKITSQLGMIIACLLLLFFFLRQVTYMSTRLLGDRIVENVPNVLEFIPTERTENPRNKFAEFPTCIFGAKPESSNAKTNDGFHDSSQMDGKVKPPNIQVFINFRGDQLRNNFVGYLVAALRGSGINVFIDNHEQRGEDLNTLFKRIEDSGIAIVVFSSRYTESEWCLDELVKIKERVHQRLLKVLPIFYKVTPGNVKRLKGEFGDNFRDKEYMYQSDEPKIKQWKEAIVSITKKHALTFDEKSSVLEIDFIETIVKEVLKML